MSDQPKQVGKRGRSVAKGMIELESVFGTRDVYPTDMRVRQWLFDQFHAVARMFAFEEYDAPLLEDEELFKRKGGEEISTQMYCFKAPDGSRLALRPEMTPSLVRLFLKRRKTLQMPLKWYSIPQCWRYESTTVGRKREHYQWNMDIVGVAPVTAEAELLAALVFFFERLGLTANDVRIKVNSRRVLETIILSILPQPQLFTPICTILDKMDKLGKDEVTTQLQNLDPTLTDAVIRAILDTLSLRDLHSLKTKLDALQVSTQPLEELQRLWCLAQGYGYDKWLEFDATIVRGLSYYTGIVFEVFDVQGEFRAIAGGGRYDHLLAQYGAKQDVPFCGFAMGDCVLLRLLERKQLLPGNLTKTNVDYVVFPFNETLYGAAFAVAAKLRAKGHCVDVSLKKQRLKRAYTYADRIGANYAVLVAPKEWSQGYVRVKALREKQDNAETNILFDNL